MFLTVYRIFLYPNVTNTIIILIINLYKNNINEFILIKSIINVNEPSNDPDISLYNLVFLFSSIDNENNNIKSNRELVNKIISKYTFIFHHQLDYKKKDI